MASKAQKRANRDNAQLSTGPRTDAGKKVARSNSVVHGLSGKGVCLTAEDEVRRAARLAEWADEAGRLDKMGRDLLGLIATEYTRLERVRDQEVAALADRTRDAVEQWDQERRAEFDRWTARFGAGGRDALPHLLRSSAGCRWLAAEWRRLVETLDRAGHWSGPERNLAFQLLADAPTRRDADRLRDLLAALDAGGAPAAEARAGARRLARGRIRRLLARGRRLRAEVEGPGRDEAQRRAAFDDTSAGQCRVRYRTAADLALHRSLKSLERRQARADRLAADGPAPAGRRRQATPPPVDPEASVRNEANDATDCDAVNYLAKTARKPSRRRRPARAASPGRPTPDPSATAPDAPVLPGNPPAPASDVERPAVRNEANDVNLEMEIVWAESVGSPPPADNRTPDQPTTPEPQAAATPTAGLLATTVDAVDPAVVVAESGRDEAERDPEPGGSDPGSVAVATAPVAAEASAVRNEANDATVDPRIDCGPETPPAPVAAPAVTADGRRPTPPQVVALRERLQADWRARAERARATPPNLGVLLAVLVGLIGGWARDSAASGSGGVPNRLQYGGSPEPGPGVRPSMDCRPPELLFAYGTLGPADADAAATRDGGWSADAVRGRLFDLGPYPALVDHDDPAAGWVEGHVRPVEAGELEGRLDAYEGVGEGLYRRVATTTRAGRRAWVYLYARPLPGSARGPLSRWREPPS